MKRGFDIVVSLLLIFLFSPVFLVVALMIKIDGFFNGMFEGMPVKTTILYKSRRRGKNGNHFNMLKFRSMIPFADVYQQSLCTLNEAKGEIFKIRKDPRITYVGKIIRKTSIDELPQLFNVLKGEMSLVGPRPLPIDQFNPKDIRQVQRLCVRPGITGLWQTRGRSETSFERMLKWDLWYIKNQSLWLDIKILVKTIPAVLKGRGAY